VFPARWGQAIKYARARQISTTKGTGGDLIVLEEAAYVEPGFFYETVAPLLLIGNTSLIAISTLTSEINFYTRLLRMRDKTTGLPLFTSLSIQLACKQCIDEGKAAQCVHMLHLVPRWQSSDRHVKLKTIMQVRAVFFSKKMRAFACLREEALHKPESIWPMYTNRSWYCSRESLCSSSSWRSPVRRTTKALTGSLIRRRRTDRI
jgi:hypothetical protein